MTSATLLVELLTEELPPKALPRLGETFATRIAEGLKAKGLAPADAAFRTFASPRRRTGRDDGGRRDAGHRPVGPQAGGADP